MSTDRGRDAGRHEPSRPPDARGQLSERIATEIADAIDIDWSDRSLEDLPGGLELIARVAAGYRSLGAAKEPVRFRWGPLDVLEPVGAGTFGEVWRAWDTRLALEVALKLVHTDDPRSTAADLLAEARGLARVVHPNVAIVRGADVHDGRFGLWTDFVKGPTLEEHLRARGPLPAGETIALVSGLASAVHAVHEAGYLHGDVTARNVLLAGGERPVLVDFGAASPLAADGRAASDLAGLTGTPTACAPELVDGASPSVASDVYALGALAFRLLTGRHLVEGKSLDEIRAALRRGVRPELRALRPDVPAPLRRAVERALARAADARFASAGELARALVRSAEPEHNLPRTRTTFHGRSEELNTLASLLGPGTLATCVGPGGAGKTRLAREVARAVLGDYPDGVWFVSLAEVSAGRVPESIADTLGVPAGARDLSRVIGERIADRRTLIILDNCEHVLEEVAALADHLLGASDGVALLATSRERLGVEGERVFELGPLDVPTATDRRHPVDVDVLLASPAAALFVDRARDAAGDVVLDATGCRAIAAICRRLDGLPLAIELAAAQTRTMAVAELEARLDAQLDLLVAGRRREARHRTLRDLLDWSHASLGEDERALFASLALFRSGWTLDGAHAVADWRSAARTTAAHRILAERSLVTAVRGAGASTRYRLLEPVREYAREQLGADEPPRCRFVRLMREIVGDGRVSIAERREPGYRAMMREELANASAAIDVALEVGDVPSAAALANALSSEWTLRGHYAEAIARYEQLWERRQEIPSPDLRGMVWLSASHALGDVGRNDESDRFVNAVLEEVRQGGREELAMRATSQRGNLAMSRGDFDGCEARWREALAMARRLGPSNVSGYERSRAVLLSNLAVMKRWRGDLAEAERLFSEAEGIYARLGVPDYAAFTTLHLAETAFDAGDQSTARERAFDATRRIRREGAPYQLGIALTLIARIHLVDGAIERAEASAEEALEVTADAGLPSKYVRYALSQIAFERGEHALASRHALEALREAHHKPGDVRSALGLLGLAEGARGRHEAAVRMLASAAALEDRRSGEPTPDTALHLAAVERVLAASRAALGEEAYRAAWQSGASQPFDEAARRVLDAHR